MKMNETLFRNILLDLIDENQVACGAVLELAAVEFTDAVPTLAVTLEERPVLKVNLAFVAEHAECEDDVKGVILHEFLHVLLNHTGQYKRMDAGLNLALDAVINSIILRCCGEQYVGLFRRYYDGLPGPFQLLRPLVSGEHNMNRCWQPETMEPWEIWREDLADGKLIADDVLDLVRDLQGRYRNAIQLPGGKVFIGNHEPGEGIDDEDSLDEELREALARTLRQMNGGGIFRAQLPGLGGEAVDQQFRAGNQRIRKWERTAWQLLKRCLLPDPRSTNLTWEDQLRLLPVLNESDRRATVRAMWNPILPEVRWNLPERRPSGSAQVYLDVSGSMFAEMEALVALLLRLRRHIRMPFWAFSTVVEPARFKNGGLVTGSTGGTAMNCVLKHVADTLPGKALVVTDGYIEECEPGLLGLVRSRNQEIHALVTRDGSTAALEQAGIPCNQLEPYPGEYS